MSDVFYLGLRLNRKEIGKVEMRVFSPKQDEISTHIFPVSVFRSGPLLKGGKLTRFSVDNCPAGDSPSAAYFLECDIRIVAFI
jgi:hypothetical protein